MNFADIEEGQVLEELKKPAITKVQLVKYAGASGDFNPLHTDDEFARSIGMKGVLAHGMLIMGFLGEYVAKLAGDDAEVRRFRMRFGAMTYPGDEIVCGSTVKKIYEDEGSRYIELDLHAKKSGETDIVGSGSAVLQVIKK